MNIVRGSFARSCGVLALLACAPSLLWAQGNAAAPSGFIQVRVLRPIADQQEHMEAALADVAKAQPAGTGFWHVYQSVRGPAGYIVVQPDRQFSNQPPLPQASDALRSAVRRVQNSQAEPGTLMTVQVFQDLSTGGGSPTGAPPGEFMRVGLTTTSPRNADAFLAWQRDQFVPAFGKAGGHRRGGRIAAGGNVNQFVSFIYTQQLGRMDASVATAMEQRDFQQIMARQPDLITNAQVHWYRFRPDLSFSSTQ